MIIGALAGIITGILTSLVPGLHTGLMLSLLLAYGLQSVCGSEFAIAFIACAAGTSLYTRRLAGVYHPSAGSGNVASLDPALALTAEGRGPEALRLMIVGVDSVWPIILALTVFIAVFCMSGPGGLKDINKVLSGLGLIVIVLWVIATALKSKKPFKTALGFLFIGTFGYIVLHHPQLKGNEHAMAPMMSGLFGIPIMLTVLAERATAGIPPQQEPKELNYNPWYLVFGGALGSITGFLAGLGAGSLATLVTDENTPNEDFLVLSTSAESSNDILALLLVVAAGMGRSGEAVLLGRVAGQTTIGQALIILGLVMLAAFIGRKATFALEKHYSTLIIAVPSAVWGVLVLGLALWQVYLVGNPFLAFTLTFAGVCLSLWARANYLPLQVSFAGIALPVLAINTGMAPMLNSLVFGI